MMNCANHPSRDATQLCVNCGNWYCSECMRQTPQGPRCVNCLSAKSSSFSTPSSSNSGLSSSLLPFALGVTGVTFLILGIGLAAYFGSAQFLLVCLLGLPGLTYILMSRRHRRPGISGKPWSSKTLTEKQIFVAIDRKGGKITPYQLSELTTVSEEKCKKKLNEMTVDATLRSYVTDDGNIVYTIPRLEE